MDGGSLVGEGRVERGGGSCCAREERGYFDEDDAGGDGEGEGADGGDGRGKEEAKGKDGGEGEHHGELHGQVRGRVLRGGGGGEGGGHEGGDLEERGKGSDGYERKGSRGGVWEADKEGGTKGDKRSNGKRLEEDDCGEQRLDGLNVRENDPVLVPQGGCHDKGKSIPEEARDVVEEKLVERVPPVKDGVWDLDVDDNERGTDGKDPVCQRSHSGSGDCVGKGSVCLVGSRVGAPDAPLVGRNQEGEHKVGSIHVVEALWVGQTDDEDTDVRPCFQPPADFLSSQRKSREPAGEALVPSESTKRGGTGGQRDKEEVGNDHLSRQRLERHATFCLDKGRRSDRRRKWENPQPQQRGHVDVCSQRRRVVDQREESDVPEKVDVHNVDHHNQQQRLKPLVGNQSPERRVIHIITRQRQKDPRRWVWV